MEHKEKDFVFVAYIVGASILVGAIIIACTIFYSLHGSAGVNPTAGAGNPTPTSGKVTISLPSNTPFLGNANAKVTVVEYADYQCPFCEKFFTDVLPDIKAKYIDTGKIKFVYQDFPFLGPDSNTASEASYCAGDQNKYWQYHDYLFAHQGQEGSGWATLTHQKEFAQAVGLDMTTFNTCMSSGKYKQAVLDEATAGKKYGVNATPTIFVNGVAIVGLAPASTFEDAIDASLK